MKKLILSLLLTSLAAFVFGQSVTLTPTGDEILIQTYGSLGGSFYGRNAGGTAIAPTATTINSSLTLLGARGHNGTGYPLSSQGLIGIYANQNFSNTALGTHIRFETTDDNTTTRIERMRITPNGNVGVGIASPPAKLTVAGDFALRKIQRETSSGGFNDYDRQDASIAIFENGGTLGGIAGGSEGQMLYVVSGYGNAQSSLVIRHDSPSNPTATNRILTHTGADFTISSGLGGVLLIYDANKARWRIVETPSGSGTAGWGLTGNTGTNPSTQFIGTTDAQPLAFKTNNVERMRVLSNGRVGIGTTSPISLFHSFVGDAGAVSPRTGTIGTLETNGSTGYLSILTPNTAQSGVAFGSPDGSADGSINYNHATQKLQLNTKASTRMTIDSLGNMGIGDTAPEVKLDVNGAVHIQQDLLLKERLLQPSASANYDPFDRQDKSFVTIEPSTNVTTTIKGFSLPTTASKFGTVLYVSNGSTGSIVLKHDDATVTNERIITNTGADVTITGRGGAILIYDFTGWRLIAYAQ